MTRSRFPTIKEDSVATLADAFYARVRRHPALGPIFDAAIAEKSGLNILRRCSASGRR
jgi:truncated hemoglobin YjbI